MYRLLVGYGMGGLILPLMREEECLILNEGCVGWGEKRGGKRKGRRMEEEEEGREREHWPLEFQGSEGKAEPRTIFPGCEKASQLASPPPRDRRESLKWCQSLSVRNENGRWRGYGPGSPWLEQKDETFPARSCSPHCPARGKNNVKSL